MVLVYGKRVYGKISEVGSSFIVTIFFQMQLLPLFPIESHLVLSKQQAVPIPLRWRSVLAGYLRVWGPIAVVALLIRAVVGMDGEPSDLVALWLVAGPLAFLAATIAAYTWIGKPSLDELAQRVVYAKHAGHPVDVADHDIVRHLPLRESLRERAPALQATTYRAAPDAEDAWRRVATDPSLGDRAFLEDALTLVRLESAAARGPERAARLDDHARIWRTLKKVAPDLLDKARAYRPSGARRILSAALATAATAAVLGMLGTTLAQRMEQGYGRLSEVLTSRGPQVERERTSTLSPGDPVGAETPLRRGQEVFALVRPSAWAARRWYLATVAESTASGDVTVIVGPDLDRRAVPRGDSQAGAVGTRGPGDPASSPVLR